MFAMALAAKTEMLKKRISKSSIRFEAAWLCKILGNLINYIDHKPLSDLTVFPVVLLPAKLKLVATIF